MSKKLTYILLLTLLLNFGSIAFGDQWGNVYHEVQVVDEVGAKIPDVNTVDIYAPGTTTSQVIYARRNRQDAITLPMTEETTNTTLTSDGYFSWYGASQWDFSVIDDSGNVVTNSGHRDRTASDGQIVLPSYIVSISTTTYEDDETATFGTSSDWVLQGGAVDDRMTFTPATDGAQFWIGSTSFVSDVNVFGATAGRDIMWDASRNQLSFRDSAILGFGGAAAEAAADFIISHTADAGTLVITAVSADETVHFGDGSIATDVIFQNTTTAGADVHWDDSTEEWNFGADNIGVDVWFRGDTPDANVLWDESNDELYFTLADLKIGQTSQIEFVDATDALTDWTIDLSTDEVLLFLPTETTDDQSFNIGNATKTANVRIFGTTASTVVYHSLSDAVTFNDYDVRLGTGDFIQFGDTNDFTITASSASQLDIATSVTTEVVAIDIGADTSGVDVNFFPGITGDFMRFDASSQDLIFEDVNATFMDETSAIFGDGDDFKMRYDEATKDALLMSGTAVGAKRLVINADAAYAVDANECGAVFVNQSTEGSGAAAKVVFTLPTAVAGLWYTFVDANHVAAADCNVTAASGDKINGGGAAGNWAHETDADLFSKTTLLAIDATNWVFIDDANSAAEWTDGT